MAKKAMQTMTMVLKTSMHLTDCSSGEPRFTSVKEGEHKVEIIPNPLGHKEPWLVLEGTKIGASKS